ncbi:MAG: hypothetical protein AB7D00_00405 [Rhodospirillaceae bacterium]
MLSQDIDHLAYGFAQCGDDGVTVPATGVPHLVALLRDLAAQARALEAAQIAPTVLTVAGDLPENVIRMAVILDRAGVRTGAALTGPGGAA